MEYLLVRGGKELNGSVRVSGSKNSSLALMASSILCNEELSLYNLPHLSDISLMFQLLSHLGVDTSFGVDAETQNSYLVLRAQDLKNVSAPYDMVSKMRASILVLGPLLARMGSAEVALPGGCAIGVRPINLHIEALKKLGVEIDIRQGYIEAKVKSHLRGNRILFPKVSVGATANTIMAAVLSRGDSELINCAMEPEIIELTNCLRAMGASIENGGERVFHISGVDRLNRADYRISGDRIEAGTYAIAAAVIGGDIEIENIDPKTLSVPLLRLKEAGAEIEYGISSVKISNPSKRLNAVSIETDIYPGFPTDLQAQFMVAMSLAKGSSIITESIFDNRFMHSAELARMGAQITVKGSCAHVKGVKQLKGAEVMATDLRASVSLVIAALAALGESKIHRVYHLDRGYERIEEKFSSLGGIIKRVIS